MAGVGPLVPHQVGALSPGDFAIIRYNVPEELWHVRLLLSHVHQGLWVILTPDGDLYMEELSEGNRDILGWRAFDPNGPAPYGIAPNQMYGFRNYPDAAAVQRLRDEGARHAQEERARLGLPAAAVAAANPARRCSARRGQPSWAGSRSDSWSRSDCWWWRRRSWRRRRKCWSCGCSSRSGSRWRCRPLACWGRCKDSRHYRDETGMRFKDFRTAAAESKPVEFGDWPIGGPRTTKHVITQMLDHGGSAIAHHQAWRIACKF